jgi:hypothetical protein
VCSWGRVKPTLSGGIGPETVITRGAIGGSSLRCYAGAVISGPPAHR